MKYVYVNVLVINDQSMFYKKNKLKQALISK